MKKNISINISGIIFHIEEDGYENLKRYLEEINRYFSNYEDNQEIIADIEGRIAEIFYAKLSEEKQIITLHDVETLIATMGSVADFQVLEEGEEKETQEKTKEYTHTSNTETQGLYRDGNRKILGGVAAGIANYFKIDPVWIRLAIILLTLVSAGTLIVAYIISWMILPEHGNLSQTGKAKKMFRDPENKVLGGVASGAAAYFGSDPTAIRVLFVLSIFLGGTGILIYALMWIILPEANTITDKVQMQGEPVTLSSIESNIKKEMNEEDSTQESVFMKILLFPFRLLATLLKGLGKVLGPLFIAVAEIARILIGLVIMIKGLALLIAIGITAGMYFGFLALSDINPEMQLNFPFELLYESIPHMGVFFATLLTVIPALTFILIGISVIAKRWIIKAPIAWSMFGIWVFSVIMVGIFIPSTIYKFKEEGRHTITTNYDIEGTLVLSMEETGMDDYHGANIRIRGWDGDNIKTYQEFEARGNSRIDAIENAKSVEYNIVQEDSILTFDSNIAFKEDAKFRGQNLDIDLFIPYNTPFKMTKGISEIIHFPRYRFRNQRYEYYNSEAYTWMVTPAGIECYDCNDTPSNYDDGYNYGSSSLRFDIEDFQNVNIGNAFTVSIVYGETYKVNVSGEEEDLDEVIVEKIEGDLDVKFKNDRYNTKRRSRRKMKVSITMPELQRLKVKGASKTTVKGFDSEQIEVEMSGASEVEINSDYDAVEVALSGNSKLELRGDGNELNASLSGSSQMTARSYRVLFAHIKADGISKATTNVTERLYIDASFTSDIKNYGNAEVVTDENEIEKRDFESDIKNLEKEKSSDQIALDAPKNTAAEEDTTEQQ